MKSEKREKEKPKRENMEPPGAVIPQTLKFFFFTI